MSILLWQADGRHVVAECWTPTFWICVSTWKHRRFCFWCDWFGGHFLCWREGKWLLTRER